MVVYALLGFNSIDKIIIRSRCRRCPLRLQLGIKLQIYREDVRQVAHELKRRIQRLSIELLQFATV